MSILRLKSLILYQSRNNVTWEFAEVYLWSSIEIGVGIICACLPTLRLVLVRILPVLAGTTVRSSNQWHRQSGKGTQNSCSTAQNSQGKLSPPAPVRPSRPIGSQLDGLSRVVTINGRTVAGRPSPRAGIEVDNYFVVQYPEGSDISLILMKPDGTV